MATTQMDSLPFWGNDVNIANATPVVTGSGAGSITISLGLSDTYGGTYTYETVTSGVKHTFTATGKWIKWRIVGETYTVTKLEVTINT